MRYSPVFNSSPHCLPSPDGRFIATLLPAHINIEAVDSLDTIRAIRLPPDLAGDVLAFSWSPSSSRVLVAVADQAHVFSATAGHYHATIKLASSALTRCTLVCFGATDDEVCAFVAHGLKLCLYNLSSTGRVEISNPKFYKARTAGQGFCFRPASNHLALLTSAAGKDTLSIHAPDSREVQRSWVPDLVDVQAIAWTPDGKWLVVWESAAQGHRVLFFTPDGQLFKDWRGPLPHHQSAGVDYRLGAGVKVVAFSASAQYAVIGDYGRWMLLLSLSFVREQLQLYHPLSIEPGERMQVWQEQSSISQDGTLIPIFTKASQPIFPPGRAAGTGPELATGCDFAAFDASSKLLATRLEEAPTTTWIWDMAASELRAVLILYNNTSTIEWHPLQPGLLLLKCGQERYQGIAFTWHPLSDGPRAMDLASNFPDRLIRGKTSTSWLKSTSSALAATIFFADSKLGVLGSLAEAVEDMLPWRASLVGLGRETATATASPPHVTHLTHPRHDTETSEDDDASDLDEARSERDDTFHFKARRV